MEHPNKRVTEFFYNLLEQAINSNFISKKELRKEIMLSHVSTKYEKLLQDSY